MASRSTKIDTSFDRPLKRGSRGQEVEQLQTSLMELKLMREGNATGYYGTKTERAVRTLETKANRDGFDFTVDGKLSTKELATLQDLNLLHRSGSDTRRTATVNIPSPSTAERTQALHLPSRTVDNSPVGRFASTATNLPAGPEPDIRALWHAPAKLKNSDPRHSRVESKVEAVRKAARLSPGLIGSTTALVSLEKGVDPKLIASIIRYESGNDNSAISYKTLKTGEKVPIAYGAMQLIPSTAESLGYSADSIHGDTATEVRNNISAGTAYFNSLLKRHKGNLPLALAAYNAGPLNVDNGNAFKYPETRAYVARVMNTYQKESGIPVNEYYADTMSRFAARDNEPRKVAQNITPVDNKPAARRTRR